MRRLAKRRWPGVRLLELFQLTPELAHELARADLAIFVDARLPPGEPVVIETVAADAGWDGFTHASGVEALLGLTRTLFGRAPRAWIVGVTGSDFSFRDGISPRGFANAELALREIEELARM